MKITRSNYESWFLDFLEGNLDPSIADEFQVFLKENPDLAAELEMGDLITLLTNESIRFDAKEELKKTVSCQEPEFQERAVAYYEGDLSFSERINFEASLLENSIQAMEAAQFGKLKLVADEAIVYPNKEQLKRRGVILPLWIKVASVAAILLLAYLLFQPRIGMQPELGEQVAVIKNQSPKNVAIAEVKGKVQKKAEKITSAVHPKKTSAEVLLKQKQAGVDEKSGTKLESTQQLSAPEPEPSLLKPKGISFGQPAGITLVVMTLKDTAQVSGEFEVSDLLKMQLAAMRNSDDRELLSTEHLSLSGLQLFAKLTGKRLTARKGDDGVVKSVSYNSRLLAFSIPVNR